MRIGNGYDAHRLVEGRRLILGGMEIPYEKGLLGYSDADVLVHAIMDAILGAAGEGDMGRHFPDTNHEFKDISSLRLLQGVKSVISRKGLNVTYIDAIVVAEAPPLVKYFPWMIKKIAATLDIDEERINLKATTTEGLGFTGRGEGIAAHAVCLLHEIEKE